jgi:hypothetical protein
MNVEIKLDRQTAYHPGDFIKARVILNCRKETTIQIAQITLICEEKFLVKKIDPLLILLELLLNSLTPFAFGGTNAYSAISDRHEGSKQVFFEDRIFPSEFNQYFDLKLEIPPDAIPSLEGRDLKVKWWVEGRLNPKKGFDIVAKSKLVVSCTMPEERSVRVIDPSEFDTNCPPEKMEISFILPRSAWVCGETIEGQLSVHGHEDLDFTKIQVALIQSGNWFYSKETVSSVNLSGNTTITAEQNLAIPFKVIIPRGMTPTVKSKHKEISWQLEGILTCTPTEEYEIVLPIHVYSEN